MIVCNKKLFCIIYNNGANVFSGFFSNHSLRATCATRLYQAGVDEQLITERTGHTSLAVRSYKRSSTQQSKAVCKIVQGGSGSSNSTPNAHSDGDIEIAFSVKIKKK